MSTAEQKERNHDIRDFMAASVSGQMFGAPAMSGAVHICSIFPREVRAQRPHMSLQPNPQYDPRAPSHHPDAQPFRWSMQTTYILPAAPDRDHPSVLRIDDTAQMIMNATGDESPRLFPAPISARVAATALVSKWTDYTIGADAGRKLGIGIIEGEQPTPEEKSFLEKQQTELFMFLVREADRYDHEHDRNKIKMFHIDALHWLGLKRNWEKSLHHEEMKECMACQASILSQVEHCTNCGTNLVEYLAGSPWHDDEVKKRRDPYCFELALRLREYNAKKAAPIVTPQEQAAVPPQENTEPIPA